MVNGLALDARGEHVSMPGWIVPLPDHEATERLARILADELQPGRSRHPLGRPRRRQDDARPRADPAMLAGDPDLDVPSPTFTLMQVYEGAARVPSSMRISTASSSGAELVELGWDEVHRERHRARRMAGARRDGAEARPSRHPPRLRARARARGALATLTGTGAFAAAARSASRPIRALLERARLERGARASRCQGDASVIRAYERLVKPSGETALLMISPPRAGRAAGAPRQALQRHRQARRDACMPSSPWTGACGRSGFSAPHIYGEDLEAGLLLIEDLGDEPCHRRARARSRSAMRRRRGFSPSSTARRCRRCCRSRTASSTRSRPTISKRC